MMESRITEIPARKMIYLGDLLETTYTIEDLFHNAIEDKRVEEAMMYQKTLLHLYNKINEKCNIRSKNIGLRITVASKL